MNLKNIKESDYNITPEKSIGVLYEENPLSHLLIMCNNWAVYGNDRGGTLKNLKSDRRTSPCVNPFREIFIAYDGTVKSCCNIYFDAKDIFGNIENQSVVDTYFTHELTAFRRSLFDFSEKSGGCAYCNTDKDIADEKSAKKRTEILGNL